MVKKIRNPKLRGSMAVWVQERPQKKPARIKVSLSRPLSESEKQYWADDIAKHGFVTSKGETRTMILRWEPHTGCYRADFRKARFRLSANEQVYAESNMMGSVRLFDHVSELLEEYFVNIHPTAVRTLRELA